MVTHPEIDKVLRILTEFQGANTMLGRMQEKYDSFRILISTILSARAKDEVTEVIAGELFKRYPNAKSLASAKKNDVIKIIKRIGFYNNKAKNVLGAAKKIKEEFGGKIPRTMKEILTIPGVARKTANVVLGNAYGIVEGIAVDTHVKRFAQKFDLTTHTDPVKIEKDLPNLDFLIQ